MAESDDEAEPVEGSLDRERTEIRPSVMEKLVELFEAPARPEKETLSLRFLGLEEAHVPVFALGRGQGHDWTECEPPKRYGPTPVSAVDLEQWASEEGMDPRQAQAQVAYYRRHHPHLFRPYEQPESVRPWDEILQGPPIDPPAI